MPSVVGKITKGAVFTYIVDGANIGNLTALKALVSNGDGVIIVSNVSATELAYLIGVTSAIQTQLNAKLENIVEDTTPQLGGNLDLNEKNIQLKAAPADDHTVSGTIITLTAAQTTNFGDVCYIASTGKATLVDADGIATASGIVMCADASIAADASGNWLVMGIARDDTWNWTVGGKIYITVTGTTGNTLSQTTPTGDNDVIQIIGIALSADIILFKPELTQVEYGT